MTDEEINRTIAEFMGKRLINVNEELGYDTGTDRPWRIKGAVGLTELLYTEDLNALVPVVEKLDVAINVMKIPDLKWGAYIPKGRVVEDDSPSRALAMAICEVLKSEEVVDGKA